MIEFLIYITVCFLAGIIFDKYILHKNRNDSSSNYTSYRVDDTFPIVKIKHGDLLFTVSSRSEMIDCINSFNFDIGKYYFYIDNEHRYIEYDNTVTAEYRFRYVKLDIPPYPQ